MFRKITDLILGRKSHSFSLASVTGAYSSLFGRSGQDYIDEGYNLNATIAGCVDIRAKAVASIPLIVQVDGEDAPDHDLQKLLNAPNPYQAGPALIRDLVSYKLITGNTYLERMGANNNDINQEPLNLRTWKSQRMQVAVNQESLNPVGYTYQDGAVNRQWDVDIVTGKSKMLHWFTFNPNNLNLGQSPMVAAALDIDQSNSASRWNANLFKNSAEPSGLLTVDSVLSDAQYKQIKERMDRDHSGVENAKKFMILEGGLTFQQTALSPKELDWLQGQKFSAQAICARYQVASQLMNIEGAQTFANFEQARQALYEDVAIPDMRDLVAELNGFLSYLYKDRPVITFSIDNIPALSSKRAATWLSMTNATWLTTNEKREATGYDEVDIPEADEILIPAGLLPLGIDLFAETSSLPSDEKRIEAMSIVLMKERNIEKAPAMKLASQVLHGKACQCGGCSGNI